MPITKLHAAPQSVPGLWPEAEEAITSMRPRAERLAQAVQRAKRVSVQARAVRIGAGPHGGAAVPLRSAGGTARCYIVFDSTAQIGAVAHRGPPPA
ncbi:hypothetical protein FML87_33775 [Rhizobium leguminosarum bv. phaseoli]|nr:hypothetical protein [Rhizobium leguminosarum bv. phaseoli]